MNHARVERILFSPSCAVMLEPIRKDHYGSGEPREPVRHYQVVNSRLDGYDLPGVLQCSALNIAFCAIMPESPTRSFFVFDIEAFSCSRNATARQDVALDVQEIGRASCRERV